MRVLLSNWMSSMRIENVMMHKAYKDQAISIWIRIWMYSIRFWDRWDTTFSFPRIITNKSNKIAFIFTGCRYTAGNSISQYFTAFAAHRSKRSDQWHYLGYHRKTCTSRHSFGKSWGFDALAANAERTKIHVHSVQPKSKAINCTNHSDHTKRTNSSCKWLIFNKFWIGLEIARRSSFLS